MTEEVKILFFAKARELVGEASSTLKTPKNCSQNTLFDLLEENFSELRRLDRRYLLALNEEYVDDNSASLTLTTGDELAVIPPISGG
jgi:molybdopterin converting factor subunit 1